MADVAALWGEVMPEVKNSVTGVGVWSALNHSRAVAYEDGQFVLGVPGEVSDLAGHLRMQQTRTLIERFLTQKMGVQITLRVIEGTSISEWENIKRRDAEAKRLQDQALTRHRAESQARSSWDTIYEQISRKYAAIVNKSLPQNKAIFFTETLDIIIDGLRTMGTSDEMAERNYARCIERVATYAEVPSTIVALELIERMEKWGG